MNPGTKKDARSALRQLRGARSALYSVCLSLAYRPEHDGGSFPQSCELEQIRRDMLKVERKLEAFIYPPAAEKSA